MYLYIYIYTYIHPKVTSDYKVVHTTAWLSLFHQLSCGGASFINILVSPRFSHKNVRQSANMEHYPC